VICITANHLVLKQTVAATRAEPLYSDAPNPLPTRDTSRLAEAVEAAAALLLPPPAPAANAMCVCARACVCVSARVSGVLLAPPAPTAGAKQGHDVKFMARLNEVA
jgi:hypothetical protein